MKTDNLFYRLFKTLPSLVFELAGMPIPPSASCQFHAEEVKQTAFRLDGVLHPPKEQAELPVVFAEVQFQPDPEFYRRFFSEIFLYLRHYKRSHPWHAVVIYAGRSIDVGDTQPYTALLDSPQVHRIYLEDFRHKPATSIGLELIQLILAEEQQALTHARDLAERSRKAPRESFWRHQVMDLIETILVYKLPHLNREAIQTMLNLTDTDLKKSRFYQEVFAEGKQKGKQEGKEEGELLVLKRLLVKRFGPLAPEVEQRLQHAGQEQLELWVDRLLEAKSLDEVFEDSSRK